MMPSTYGVSGRGSWAKLLFADSLLAKANNLLATMICSRFGKGTDKVDSMDFQTENGETIEVTTASKDFHRRIIVPAGQFNNRPMDYYVGVRVSEDETTGTVIGYATRADMQLDPPQNRGEGLGYERFLNYLRPIQELVDRFPEAE